MRPYLAVLTLRLREVSQYRAAAWAGVFTQIVFGFIIFMSIDAFFAADPSRAPMSRDELIAYVWLGQAFLALLPWNIDRDLAAMTRTGTLAYELSRPLDLYALWYFRTLGWRLAATALRSVPLLTIVIAFRFVGLERYAMTPPPSVGSAVAFVCAMLVAIPLGVALTMLMQVTILWTQSIDGVQRIAPAIIMLCAGMIIPIPVFPRAIQLVLYALPFRGTVDLPYRAYSGSIAPEATIAPILASIAWTVALIALGRLIMLRGFKRIVIHGG